MIGGPIVLDLWQEQHILEGLCGRADHLYLMDQQGGRERMSQGPESP